MPEMVVRMGMDDALYHAAARYEKDAEFRRGVPNPDYVAHQLREIVARREKMHAERNAR